MKKRLVLIDFQNFLFRCLKVNYQATGINKENVNVVYGFFKNLYDLMAIMESGGYDCDYICCNDNGYDARYKLSEDAVKRGIIAKTYKEDRRYIAACASDEEKAEKERLYAEEQRLDRFQEPTHIQICKRQQMELFCFV